MSFTLIPRRILDAAEPSPAEPSAIWNVTQQSWLASLLEPGLDPRLRFPAPQNQFAGFICYLLALIADKMNLTVKWCIIKGGGSRSGMVNGPFNRIWNWIILLDFNPILRMDFLELIWRCNSEDNHCLGITKIMMDGFQGTGIWN